MGFYLGYYDDPWFWGYPGYYYSYPDAYDDAPPPVAPVVREDGVAPQASVPPAGATASSAQTCGHWQWATSDQQYHWVNNGCS